MPAKKGTKGKHINANTQVVDGQLCMLLAKSGSRAIKTELYWDIRGTAPEPFVMVLTFPALEKEDDPTFVSMQLDAAGGQAGYANHPRKVHPSNIPEDCPIFDVLDALDEGGNVPKESKADPPASE